MFKRLAPLAVVISAAILVLVGCGAKDAVQAGAERTVYMAAVEPKGGATLDKEPFPTDLLSGDSYILKEPNEEGRWEVSTYRWAPGTIVVNQGDLVTLEIIGINGHEHPFVIEGYDVSGTVKRGRLTRVTFAADKAGIFKISCTETGHLPSMQADLVVLAR